MGIENRDYLREEGRGSFGPSFGGMVGVKWLIIVNVAVFVLQLLTFGTGVVTDALKLSPGSVLESFQIWRVITYAFCHAPQSIWHILFNMYVLYLVAKRLEPRYGTREFVLFYLTAALVSGLTYILLELVLARPGTAIGASGAVAAAFLLYAIHYPHERWLMFFVFPVEVRWLCMAYMIFDLHPVLLELGGGGAGGNVAHACHLGGYLFGYLYYAKNWHMDGMFGELKVPQMPRRKSHLKVFNPHDPQRDSADLEAKVDTILQKISAQGESSLTDDERSLLSEASRRLRDRTRS